MHTVNGQICRMLFLLAVTSPAQADNVFRCEDRQGHITYTQQGCPTDQYLAVQAADNLSPGAGKPVAMATSASHSRKKSGKTKAATNLTVVAGQEDGCGNRVTGSQRRTAIIRKQVQAGMTQEDVESALGKPDRQSMINGDTQYLYSTDKGTQRKVSFDQNGCVKNKR